MVHVYIDVFEALTDPALQMMVFPFINRQVVGGKLFYLSTVEVNTLEDREPFRILQLLGLQKVRGFVGE
jgi:hypothetical protein